MLDKQEETLDYPVLTDVGVKRTSWTSRGFSSQSFIDTYMWVASFSMFVESRVWEPTVFLRFESFVGTTILDFTTLKGQKGEVQHLTCEVMQNVKSKVNKTLICRWGYSIQHRLWVRLQSWIEEMKVITARWKPASHKCLQIGQDRTARVGPVTWSVSRWLT